MDQLEARIAELGSDTAAAEAKREEAQQALARARSLDEAGSGTKVSLEKARRDATVAEQTLLALGHRRTALDVELAALQNGIYVGDSYNDRPQSLQRADDIALRLNELGADIDHRQARLALLRTELVGEKARYSERSTTSLTSPVRGSIWEIMTAPGESVARGQDLVRLLDCSGLVVTATVGETAYNHLRIGDPGALSLPRREQSLRRQDHGADRRWHRSCEPGHTAVCAGQGAISGDGCNSRACQSLANAMSGAPAA